MMKTQPLMSVLLAATVLASASVAQTPAPATEVYQQSPAVLARFGDVDVPLATPGLRDRPDFTTQAELEAFLQGLKSRSPEVLLGSLGRSTEGRDIPFLVFTREGHQDLRRVRRLNRPVVWLIGQQHGNEPAGGEAMLGVAQALAEGELKPLLNRVTVVVVPRMNPDGAAAARRTNAQGLDLNRDHLLLTSPETRALHDKMRELPADVVLDAHEYGVAGPWLRNYGGLAKADVTLQSATNASVPKALSAYADRVFLSAIEQGLQAKGVTSAIYQTLGGTPEAPLVGTGGSAPGISRNNLGLTGAVSFLVETRGIGIGRQSFQRRVASHYLAARSVVQAAAREGGTLRRVTTTARRTLAATREPLPISARLGRIPFDLETIDPQTGADRVTRVQFDDARLLTVTSTRPRPAGYLLQPQAGPAIEALTIAGAKVCRLGGRVRVDAERFVVDSPPQSVNRNAINPEQTVKVTLSPTTVTPAEGGVWVSMDQPLSAVIASALEPDAAGSFVAVGLVKTDASGEAPIYRVKRKGRFARTCR